ncbi:MAG: hypothetical protein FWF05_08625 [Oscillospiraceae bacterium]|nr:hypothetical protein [Oscillospiraceae bacterium]
MDIERLATTEVKKRLALCTGLSPFISEGDKEPSWDGNIYVYPNDNCRKAELIAKVPVQVKGKKKQINADTLNFSFSAEVSDLNNYWRDGGAMYFVVLINGSDSFVFYKSLLPLDLQHILKNIGTLLEIIRAYDSQMRKDSQLLQFAIDAADLIYKKTKE